MFHPTTIKTVAWTAGIALMIGSDVAAGHQVGLGHAHPHAHGAGFLLEATLILAGLLVAGLVWCFYQGRQLERFARRANNTEQP